MSRKYKQRNAKAWADKVRDKIKADKLADRLMRYALGEKGPQGETIKLDSSQVKAAQILLAKVMPDLSTADIHDSRQEETRTYEEIRAELTTKHGEPMALFMLGEITQGQLITMMQADLTKQTETVSQTGLEPIQCKLDGTGRDVVPTHSLDPESSDHPDQDHPKLLN